jgi:hypothetical protein
MRTSQNASIINLNRYSLYLSTKITIIYWLLNSPNAILRPSLITSIVLLIHDPNTPSKVITIAV